MQATEEQKACIFAPIEGHLKVVAVPGSGKSWSLRRRTAHLITQGVNPNKILVLMYNEKAKTEFAKKLAEIDKGNKLPSVRTFHSLGYRLCNTFVSKGMLPSAHLDTSGFSAANYARQALKKISSNKAASGKASTVERFLSFVELVKCGLLTPSETFTNASIDNDFSYFIEAFEEFEHIRLKEKVRYFSDLITDPIHLIESNVEARSIISDRLSHVIVDEYQDINPISQELVKILAGNRACVTVAGDDDQSLYGWRGSAPEYLIKNFDLDFPKNRLLKFSKTFRYGHAIAIAANNVISNNSNRVSKLCIPNELNPKTSIELLEDSRDVIPTLVKGWKGAQSDIAILVRLYSMAPNIELALLRTGVKYKILGKKSILESGDLEKLVSILKIALGTFFVEGSSDTELRLESLLTLSHPGAQQAVISEVAKLIANNPQNIIESVKNGINHLPEYIITRFMKRAQAITTLQETKTWNTRTALETYVNLTDCYRDISAMSKSDLDAEFSISTIASLIEFCYEQGVELSDSIIKLERLIADNIDKDESNNDVVTITSVHRAKGLEFPFVILPSLQETQFPYIDNNDETDIESERRLFYVAITRAIQKISLVVPKDDMLISSLNSNSSDIPYGALGNPNRASRFVYEANLKCSIHLANELDSNASFSNLKVKRDASIFNMYLTKLGAQFRLSTI